MRKLPALLGAVPVAAAASALGDTLAGMTAGDWLGTLGESAVTGLVALLLRLRASQEATLRRTEQLPYDDDAIIRGNLWLYAASHLSGSVLGGFVAFWSTHDVLTSGHAVAAAIVAVAVGGAKAVEKLAERNYRYVRDMRMR